MLQRYLQQDAEWVQDKIKQFGTIATDFIYLTFHVADT